MMPWISDLIKGATSSPQRNRSPSNTTSPSRPHARTASGRLAQPLSTPYTDAHIQLARTVLIRCQGERGHGPCADCAYCAQRLENPLNPLAMLPCGHVFHERCARSRVLDALVRCEDGGGPGGSGGERVVDATCPLCGKFVFPVKRVEVVGGGSSSGAGSSGAGLNGSGGAINGGSSSSSASSSEQTLVGSMALLTTSTSSNSNSSGYITAPSNNPSTTSLPGYSRTTTTPPTYTHTISANARIIKDMPNQLEYTYLFGTNATWTYLHAYFTLWHNLETRASLNGVGHPSWTIEREDAFALEPSSLVTAFWEVHWLVYAPDPRELRLMKKPREQLERMGLVREGHPVGIELAIRERLDGVAEELRGKGATREGLLEFLAEQFEELLGEVYRARYPNWSEEDCEEIVVGVFIRWVALVGVLTRVRI